MKADFHEPHVAHGAIEGPSNRSFGLTVGGIFTALGSARSLIGWDLDLISALMLVVGVALLSLAAISPKSLGGANRLWMRLGALLARIISPVVLLLVYAVAFVPIGIVLRLRGHDPLRLKRSAADASYWIGRPSQNSMVERMRKQF